MKEAYDRLPKTWYNLASEGDSIENALDNNKVPVNKTSENDFSPSDGLCKETGLKELCDG
jgi:hypothetical protein